MSPVEAVTLDFFGTLADHADGIGRSRLFADYLATQGLGCPRFDHRVMYEAFDYYGEAFRPDSSDRKRKDVWIEFTRRLFERTGVQGNPDPEVHAGSIETIFGPNHFRLFPEVIPVLEELKRRGLAVGIVSNWHRGLNHFCAQYGILEFPDVVITSTDAGCEKPHPTIFGKAATRLGVSAGKVAHVGDSPEDDVEGARNAGMQAILLDRHDRVLSVGRKVRDLEEMLELVGLRA